MTTPQSTTTRSPICPTPGFPCGWTTCPGSDCSPGTSTDLIATQHIVGVTTNPSIFQAALKDGASYQQQTRRARRPRRRRRRHRPRGHHRRRARRLRPVHRRLRSTGHVDGRVSIEVDPRLAHDTAATIAQAQELAKIVDRPNVLIKIPATLAGLPAITAVIAEGISVNVTLIFSLDRYKAVMDAYLTGLEQAKSKAATTSPKSIPSPRSSSPGSTPRSTSGSRPSAPRKPTRCSARPRSRTPGWPTRPTSRPSPETAGTPWPPPGANKQRPLWASTGVKDPKYDDTRYVVELVAPGTVNTAPEKTIDAVRDHGVIRGNTIEGTYAQASAVFSALKPSASTWPTCSTVLETEGVQKFEQSWTELLESVGQELDRHKAAAN